MCVLERAPALAVGAESYDGTNWHPFEAPVDAAAVDAAAAHTHAPLHSAVAVSMQYCIGLHRLAEAVAALHVIDEYHGREIEVKFVRRAAGSSLGAGSDCDGTCVCVNIWWELPAATIVETLAPFESAMLKLGGTAHLGKLHDQSKVASPSPRTVATIGQCDPLQTFAPAGAQPLA
jgi:hypothetical protein